MGEPKPSPDPTTLEFVRLGCKVSSHFHTGPIREWPTASAVIEVLAETREKFPTRRVLEALQELFSDLRAVAAGLEVGPVIYLALPVVANDAIGAAGREEDAGADKLVSSREHQEMAEVIMDTMADVGAWVSVRYSTLVYPVREKDPHTVRASWL
jgi:hypothetical protein